MNRLLADTAPVANAILAFCLVAWGGWYGRESFSGFLGSTDAGILMGFVFGFLVAASVCGLVAQITDIRALLTEIRDQGKPSP